MHLLHLATILIWTVSLISILLMLVRPRGIAEVYWAGGGALVLIVSGLISLRAAGQAVRAGFDVYLFLTGMMILAELAREEGVFDWVADVAAQHANGSPSRLFLLIYVAGTIVTALLSNDATAVVLTPAVLAVVRRAKVEPKPYLFACALIANAASFVFPISNPANLVVFDEHMPVLGQWLRIFLVPSIVSSRDHIRVPPPRVAKRSGWSDRRERRACDAICGRKARFARITDRCIRANHRLCSRIAAGRTDMRSRYFRNDRGCLARP